MKSSKFHILYKDEELVVIDKPAGLRSIPDRFNHGLPNAYLQLFQLFGEIYLVHRLDVETSGAMIFARTKESHSLLCGQFEKGLVNKHYITICEGAPSDSYTIIDRPIREHPVKRGKYEVHPTGKPSRSSVKIIEQFREFSYLQIELLTGRTHQIRVHLQSIGCPVLADKKYGLREQFYLSDIKKKGYRPNRYKLERPLIARQALHAFQLQFEHPVTTHFLKIESPPPKDFRATLNQLRKYNKQSFI